MPKPRLWPRLAVCTVFALPSGPEGTTPAYGQPPIYPPTQTHTPPNFPSQTSSAASVEPASVVPASHVAPASPVGDPRPLPDVHAAAPLPRPGTRPSAKLPPRSAEGQVPETPRSGASGFLTVAGSLALVLGLFLLTARILRRGAPHQARLLPKEAVEVLGRVPLPARRQGYLIRVGNKIVLVGFAPSGCDVLAEVDDPQEVDRLAGLCFQADPHGATQSFRGAVEHFFREKPAARSQAPAPVGPSVKEDGIG